MRASNCGVASSLRIWPITTKKRGSRERSSPPCQIRTLILPRCPEARGNIDLELNTDSKVLRTLGPRLVRAIAPAHHQTVFGPPFMTASASPLPFMTVNSGTRWLPEHLNLRLKVGRVCRPGDRSWPTAVILRWRPNVERTLWKSRVICRIKLLRNFDEPKRPCLRIH